MNKVDLIYPDLSYELRGCFFKVYNTLGFGHKEIVYQRAMEQELLNKKVPFKKESSLPILYENKKIADYRPDFVIDEKIIVEIKAMEFLPELLIDQLVYYLKGTKLKLGFLVNFGSPKLKIIRRVWSPNYINRISGNQL